MATREYFPRKFRAAVRQRTRWITGIALQSWQRHGWRDTRTQLYWFWRDRKGLVDNLAAPLSNVLFLYGAHVAVERMDGRRPGAWRSGPEPFLRYAFFGTLGLQIFPHGDPRVSAARAIYGWRFASAYPCGPSGETGSTASLR